MKYIEIKKPELDYYSSEACKALRTNLQFCGSDKKAIVFTSCTQNEGKTYVILNLAISLSEIGKKVLLLDADLRKSALLGRVEVSSEMKGLTHFLSKQASLVDIICQTNVPNFYMENMASMASMENITVLPTRRVRVPLRMKNL